MTDFPQATCEFLNDLARNNTRDWFEANRDRYNAQWLQPAISYVTALTDATSHLTPPHQATAKLNGSIRRLNRDTRFSKDKTPYDPKLHLIFWVGDHPNRSPAIHFVLRSDSLGFGAGQFALTSTELDRYRDAVSDNKQARAALRTHLAKLADQGCTLTDETLKRVPNGYDMPEEDETLLKRKGLVARTQSASLPPSTLTDHKWMQKFLSDAAMLNQWLVKHVSAPK